MTNWKIVLVVFSLCIVAACSNKNVSDEGQRRCGPETTTFPWQMVWAAHRKKIYVSDAGANRLLIVSPKAGAVITTIPTKGKTIGLATSPDGQLVYATVFDTASIIVVDAERDAIIDEIPLKMYSPQNIEVDERGQIAYVESGAPPRIQIVDLKKKTTVKEIPSQRYLVTGKGLEETQEKWPGRLPFLRGGLLINFKGTLLASFASNLLSDIHSVNISYRSNQKLFAHFDLSSPPDWALFSLDDKRLYVAVEDNSAASVLASPRHKMTYIPPSIIVIDLAIKKIVAAISLPGQIGRGIFSSDGKLLYVIRRTANPPGSQASLDWSIAVIDVERNQVTREIPIDRPDHRSCRDVPEAKL